MRVSLVEYRDNPKARKHQKYRNRVTETADGRFDSEAEYRHWCHLKLRQRAGEIADLPEAAAVELVQRGIVTLLEPATVAKRKAK